MVSVRHWQIYHMSVILTKVLHINCVTAGISAKDSVSVEQVTSFFCVPVPDPIPDPHWEHGGLIVINPYSIKVVPLP